MARRARRKRFWILAISVLIMALGVVLPIALAPTRYAITLIKIIFGYISVFFASSSMTFGWSPLAFNFLMKETARFSDDLWLTGVKGKEIARAVLLTMSPRSAHRFLIIGILDALLGGWILYHPIFWEEIMLSAYLLWNSGFTLGAYCFRGEFPPLLSFWAEGSVTNTTTQLWRKGARMRLAEFPGRAIRQLVKIIPIFAIGFPLGFLPPFAFIWLFPHLRMGSFHWSPSMIVLTIAFFPSALLITAAWGLYARRRAPTIEAAMAVRFDNLLELRRVLNHELKNPGVVGGKRS